MSMHFLNLAILKFWSIKIVYILGIFKGKVKLVLESLCVKVLGFREIGKMIRSFRDIKLRLKGIIRGGLRLGWGMVRDSLSGEMGKNIKANGAVGINMVLAFGNRAKEIATLDSGVLVKFKVTVCI